MKNIFFSKFLFVTFLVTELILAGKLENNSKPDSVVANTTWEHAFFSKVNYANPYKDVILSVIYYNSDSTKTYNTYGFWDGDSTFKIRSSFPEVGRWYWKTTCSNESDTSLHNRSGIIEVSEYIGNNKIYKHGPLKISSNKKYITYRDGTPFLWMGGTAWALPMAATFNEWKHYIDDRHSKKFTIIQIAPAKSHGYNDFSGYPENRKGDVCFYSDDKWNPLYWQEFDRFIEYANLNDIIPVIVGVSEPVYDKLNNENAKLFARNLSARMEGYHVILAPAFDTYQPSWNSDYDTIGVALQSYSRHLITQHTGHTYSDGPYNSYVKYFLDKDYLDFSMNHTGHNGGDLVVVYRKAKKWNLGLYNELPVKPKINTEAYYASGKYSSQITNRERSGTDKNARDIGWISWLCGSLGYTYGATGIWQYGEETDDNLTIPLDSAINFASSTHMKYLVDFFTALEWWKLQPDLDAIISNEQDETKKPVFSVAEDSTFGVAFLPNNSFITLDMNVFANRTNAFWFKPTTNTFSKADPNVNNSGEHTFIPPSAGEWVLLLKNANNLGIAWQQNIKISTETDTLLLTFGKAENATDTIDIINGESELPPIPPQQNFDARFILANNTSALLDLRDSNATEIIWTIQFQPGSNGYPVTFSWDKTKLPFGSFFLKDAINGNIINLDMKLTDNITIHNDAIKKIRIVYKKEYQKTVSYNKGWNLISIPLKSDSMTTDYIFSGINSSPIKFDNHYQNVQELENGFGYWMKFKQKKTINIYGDKPNKPTPVKAGWNMIGSYDEDIASQQLRTNPSDLLVGDIYGFENGHYYITDKLEAGKGYWMKMKTNGEVYFNNNKSSGKLNYLTRNENETYLKIKVIAADLEGDSIALIFGLDSLATKGVDTILGEEELPPLPPQGVFDARIKLKDTSITSYSDIRYLTAGCKEHIVKYQLSDNSNGLKLKWNLPEGVTLNIIDMFGGSLIDTDFDSGMDSLTITNTNINSLKLTFCYNESILSVKEEKTEMLHYMFELQQNYPNPFNPTTTIKYTIPTPPEFPYQGKSWGRVFVTLKVYNILGKEVATLVQKQQLPGNYSVSFDASNLSSGIYFYKLQSGDFVKIKKMVLLK